MIRIVFVTGGVCSSLGKGVVAASIAALLQARGLHVGVLKIDPYLNVDPGTMSPQQHGEVYVTDDGTEADMDLGHYERFAGVRVSRESSLTAGQVYRDLLATERQGDLLGATVQVVPHVTDAVEARIRSVAGGCDVLVCEIGGTVGDIESLPFLETVRRVRQKRDVLSCSVHLVLVPYLAAAGEMKTKPAQHSVQRLREIGISPDVLVCRSDRRIPKNVLAKLSLHAGVEKVVPLEDLDTPYRAILALSPWFSDLVGVTASGSQNAELGPWQDYCQRRAQVACLRQRSLIRIVGKYNSKDAYRSITEALEHAAVSEGVNLSVEYMDADEPGDLEWWERSLRNTDGILIPGGFGSRGFEGMVRAAQIAREEEIPFFGICLGMQAAVVEFARNVAGLEGANSTEIDPATPHPLFRTMEGRGGAIGGTLRLGIQTVILGEGSVVQRAYGKAKIAVERHRHRYEFNDDYFNKLNGLGLNFVGSSPGFVELVEAVELPQSYKRCSPSEFTFVDRFHVGVQFHPEFKSRPPAPHPLFCAFVRAVAARTVKYPAVLGPCK